MEKPRVFREGEMAQLPKEPPDVRLMAMSSENQVLEDEICFV
jgi:hypothetical protein